MRKSLSALSTEPAVVDAVAGAIIGALAPLIEDFEMAKRAPRSNPGLYRWRRAMKQIVDRLKGHIEAGFEPMPRGDAPADDTLQLALAEIERVRGALADEWARIAELRCRIAELGELS